MKCWTFGDIKTIADIIFIFTNNQRKIKYFYLFWLYLLGNFMHMQCCYITFSCNEPCLSCIVFNCWNVRNNYESLEVFVLYVLYFSFFFHLPSVHCHLSSVNCHISSVIFHSSSLISQYVFISYVLIETSHTTS